MSIEFQYKPLSMSDIEKIESWTYTGFMTSVDMSFYYQNYRQKGLLKGPHLCDGYGVFVDNELYGLLEVYEIEQGIEMGLALNPKYVGKGLSKGFILNCIDFLKSHYAYMKNYIYLSVDKKNHQAYYAYIKTGFKVYKESEAEFYMRMDV
jgi:ribosomal-protein-alanine N-acetyltransferase